MKTTKVRDTITPDIARKIRAMQNPQNALRAMGTVFVSLAKRSFNEADARLLPWDPLKPATIKAKIRKGYSEGILKASGALMKSPAIIPPPTPSPMRVLGHAGPAPTKAIS